MECSSRLARTRKFAASVVLLALLMQPSYAQPFPEFDRQKAQEERKKADDKATDEAYKALMKHLPDSNKKVDPWGALRAPLVLSGIWLARAIRCSRASWLGATVANCRMTLMPPLGFSDREFEYGSDEPQSRRLLEWCDDSGADSFAPMRARALLIPERAAPNSRARFLIRRRWACANCLGVRNLTYNNLFAQQFFSNSKGLLRGRLREVPLFGHKLDLREQKTTLVCQNAKSDSFRGSTRHQLQ